MMGRVVTIIISMFFFWHEFIALQRTKVVVNRAKEKKYGACCIIILSSASSVFFALLYNFHRAKLIPVPSSINQSILLAIETMKHHTCWKCCGEKTQTHDTVVDVTVEEPVLHTLRQNFGWNIFTELPYIIIMCGSLLNIYAHTSARDIFVLV